MAFSTQNGDILEFKSFCSGHGQLFVNVRHWLVYGVVGGGAPDVAILASLEPSIGVGLKTVLATAFRYEGCTLQRIQPTRDPFIFNTGSAGAGAIADEPLPKQVAGLATLLTAGTGRANRGRLYLAGWVEADNTSASRPSAPAVGGIAALAALFTQNFTTVVGPDSSQLASVIYHRGTGTSTLITGVQARTYWATQRRRGDFGRPNQLPWLFLVP